MILRSKARDCLFLNWAVPARHLPPPPSPLRLEVQEHDGVDHAFVTALLFRQEGLHDPRVPKVSLSHPQCNLSVCVRDEHGQPGMLFTAVLLPWWLVPGARWLAGQPSLRARFAYPAEHELASGDSWQWRVRRRGGLAVTARRGAAVPQGPDLGSWQRTVDFFRQRPKGFVCNHRRLRTVETSHPPVEVWPLRAEVQQTRLLERLLPLPGLRGWPALHSAFLCPEIPSIFELVPEERPALAGQLPAPG
jgi:hypothetical protein